MNLHKTLLVVGLSLVFFSCKKSASSSIKPQISNLQQSGKVINIYPGSQDTLLFGFDFKDGNADINGGNAKVVFKNLVDTADSAISYPFPQFSAALDANKGVTGSAVIFLDATAILFQFDDTTKTRIARRYEMYMADDAGNKSNVLKTDSVLIINEP